LRSEAPLPHLLREPRPVHTALERPLDDFRRHATPAQVLGHAHRTLAARHMRGDVVLGEAGIVQAALADEVREHPLDGRRLEVLGGERAAQLGYCEVAPRQELQGSLAGRRGIRSDQAVLA